METKPLNNQTPSNKKKENSTLKNAAMAGAGVVGGAGAAAAASYFAGDHDEPGEEIPTVEAQAEEEVHPAGEAHAAEAPAAAVVSETPEEHPVQHPVEHPVEPPVTPGHHEEHPVTPEHPEPPVTPDHTDDGGDDDKPIDPDSLPEISAEEIDSEDYDGEAIVNFDQVTTAYTETGEEITAAHAFLPDGEEIVMVDVDGDEIFDSMHDTEGNLISYDTGGTTVGDAEIDNDEEIAYIDPSEHEQELPDGEDFMNDIIDA